VRLKQILFLVFGAVQRQVVDSSSGRVVDIVLLSLVNAGAAISER